MIGPSSFKSVKPKQKWRVQERGFHLVDVSLMNSTYTIQDWTRVKHRWSLLIDRIVSELISFDDFSSEDIIRIVENDYRTYFQELCGYDLSMDPKHSMIFNVL